MQNSPVAVGDTIAQKYQVEKVIGEGGMGLVVAAWHLGLQQRVAIKFVLAEFALDHDGSSERFRREARAAAKIRSEHVCRVLDVGTLDNGVPFMVMEYLEGCDLAEELTRQGRLSISDAVEYVLQACEALAEAHAAGIVHRDLKPANLFLARRADGTRAIKVLDFGVSKLLAEPGISHLSLTKSATLIGSPIYMSPEQLESSKDVDARTDIWALGAILYQLVSGRTPFDGSSIPQLVAAVLNSEPAGFSQLGVSVPVGLEAVVLRALRKDRAQRYASVAEFTQELGPFAPAHAVVSINRVARVLGPSGRDRSAVPTTAYVAGGEPTKPRPAPTPQPVERISAPTKPPLAQRWRWALFASAPLLLGIGMLLSRGFRGASEAGLAPNAPTLPAAHLLASDAGAESEPAARPVAPRPLAEAPSAIGALDAGPATHVETPTDAVAPAAAMPSTPTALPKGVDLSRSTHAPEPVKPPASRKAHGSTTAPPPTGISDFGGRR